MKWNKNNFINDFDKNLFNTHTHHVRATKWKSEWMGKEEWERCEAFKGRRIVFWKIFHPAKITCCRCYFIVLIVVRFSKLILCLSNVFKRYYIFLFKKKFTPQFFFPSSSKCHFWSSLLLFFFHSLFFAFHSQNNRCTRKNQKNVCEWERQRNKCVILLLHQSHTNVRYCQMNWYALWQTFSPSNFKINKNSCHPE